MMGRSELRLTCVADPAAARPLRHALASFLAVVDIDPDTRDDILTGVGEALANAVEHAYPRMPAAISNSRLGSKAKTRWR